MVFPGTFPTIPGFLAQDLGQLYNFLEIMSKDETLLVLNVDKSLNEKKNLNLSC